jgi:phosphoserine aminotransferase
MRVYNFSASPAAIPEAVLMERDAVIKVRTIKFGAQ